jgi:hypothetical protein
MLSGRDVQAQWGGRTFEQDTTVDVRSGWRPMRIAKWTTLLVSGGAAAYGFVENRRADRAYEQLERECAAAPATCVMLDNGAYADPALEARYQRIVDRDRGARTALLAGQLGIAAGVILFIIDLPNRTAPEDIPYEPRPFRVGLRSDGSTELRAQIRVGGF